MIVSFFRADKYEEQRSVWGGGISRPRCLGIAPRLLERVRLLLRLGSSERSVVGMLSVVLIARLEWLPCTYLQLMFILMKAIIAHC